MDPAIRKARREYAHEERLKLLIAGILHQVARDIKALPDASSGEDLTERIHNAIDADGFLNSPTFSLICDALEVREDVMRNEILRRVRRGDLND